MGCRISKFDEPSSSSSAKLVALCRERRDLIATAVSQRYALAAAHAAYFESLAAVGEAFHRFVHEELAFPRSPPGSPVLTLPPSPKVKSRDLSDAGTVVSAARAASASSSFTPLHPLSPEGSHLPLSSESESELSPRSGSSQGDKVDAGIEEEAPALSPLRSASPHYWFSRTSTTIPTMVYQDPYGAQVNSSIDGYGYGGGYPYPSAGATIRTPPRPAVPGTPPPPSPREASPWEFFNIFNSYEQLLLNHFPGLQRYASSPDLNKVRAEEGIPELEEELELEPLLKQRPPAQQPPTGVNDEKKAVGNGAADPASTANVASAQDIEGKADKKNTNVVPVAGKASKSGSASSEGKRSNGKAEGGSSKHNKRTVGIDSADPKSTTKVTSAQETEGNDDKKNADVEPVAAGKESNNGSTSSKGKRSNKEAERGSSIGKTKSIHNGSAYPTSTTKAASPQETEGGKDDKKNANVEPVAAGKGSKNGSPGNKEKISNRVVEGGSSNGKRKGVTFENFGDAKSMSAFSASLSVSVHDTHGTRDIMESVDEIKELFKSAANCGQEVSRILEVGKLPYESKNKLHEAISSRICDPTDVPLLNCAQPSLNQTANSISSSRRNKSRKRGSEYYYRLRSVSLSSTLEKLYIWEKKLYKAVKDEQRLQINYERMYKRMKTLYGGTDPAEAELFYETIRKLQTDISIAIRTANTISTRMHNIRDEELQPQLTELIQENIRMWESMLHCHRKQWEILVDSNIQNLVVKTEYQRKPIARATKEFEQKLCNWCHSFDKWMNIQKSYIESLNGWLSKWLPEEKEITSDGVAPFSPARLGAPLAFIISNDWYHAVESISEESVIEVMCSCIDLIHLLWEVQDVEQRQRLEEHDLEQAYARKLQSLKEVTSRGHPNLMSSTENITGHSHDAAVALNSLKTKLNEKRECHKETMMRVKALGSRTLPEFIRIFEKLGDRASEILKAYNGIRIPGHSAGS